MKVSNPNKNANQGIEFTHPDNEHAFEDAKRGLIEKRAFAEINRRLVEHPLWKKMAKQSEKNSRTFTTKNIERLLSLLIVLQLLGFFTKWNKVSFSSSEGSYILNQFARHQVIVN